LKVNIKNIRMIFGLFFFLTGVVWVALAILREGTILLLEPGIVNLIVGALLVIRFGERYVRYLVVAAGLYGLIISIYQFYAAFILLQFGLTIFVIALLVGYGFLSLTFFYVIMLSYKNSQAFVISTVNNKNS